MGLAIAAAIILVSALASLHAQAQEAGDPQAGLALAREVCASCQAILAGRSRA